MGVKNLWDILESCKKTRPLYHLQYVNFSEQEGLRGFIVLDGSTSKCEQIPLSIERQALLEESVPPPQSPNCFELQPYLRYWCAFSNDLQKLNVWFLDGSIPAIKLSTYRRRLNGGDDAISDSRDSREVSSLKRNMGSEFSCMIKEAKFLGGALGIPCLDGIEEAEAQCALINSESLCDGCFTSDSDAFLFGARTVFRDICLGEGGYVVCYEMDDIERKLGFGRNSLISLAILLGSDYTQGIRGFGPESACQIVKSIGDSSVLQRFASEGLSIAKKKKSSKKNQTSTHGYKENDGNKKDSNGSECDLPIDNQFLQVIDAYMKPKCHSADSDTVHRVLAHYPVNHSQLHKISAQFFDWPPEKTDEYILPKIAERNLRRFANLRSTSSDLGVCLPINEMPVKCPVSGIVKQRKVQGRDYFEVSWEDMDGLKASVVPADLVESACPEKIQEFQLRKQKKPSGRSRKKKVEMQEIDRKLQDLVLDIERESSRLSLGGMDDQRMQLNNTELQSSVHEGEVGLASNNAGSRALETEIIDLISPPPPPPRTKCQEATSRDHVIELSDTDNDDVSPEYARKVRELRLFIANIRDEIS